MTWELDRLMGLLISARSRGKELQALDVTESQLEDLLDELGPRWIVVQGQPSLTRDDMRHWIRAGNFGLQGVPVKVTP